jgi:ABC-type transport system substrate-binding protein
MGHKACRVLSLVFLFCSALGAERAVIYLRLTDSLTLDPGKTEDFYSQEVVSNIFEGLVRLREDSMEVEPCLAERWRAEENGRRWIFHLRRGVRFHDGQFFDARAVVYSFKKRMEKRREEYVSFGNFFPYIIDVKASGDWTVEIVLSRSYFPFLLSLVDQHAMVVAPGSMDGAQFKPVGTGPFAFSEWVKGKSVILMRFAGYWRHPAKLDRIIFKCEPSSELRLSQTKNRSADMNILRSAKEYEELLGKTGIGILVKPKLSTHFLGFNCQRQPFSLPQVRKAFAHLLDKKILVKHIFQNFAVPAAGMLPPQMPGFVPNIDGIDFSPEKARNLLREAGIGKGFSCRLYFSAGQYGLEEVARAIAAKARLIDVHVTNVKLPFAELLRSVQSGKPDLFLMGWGSIGDPGVFLNPLFML